MKYLLAGQSDHLGSRVLVDGKNLEVVKGFYYLATVVTSDNDIISEIRRRNSQEYHAYFIDCLDPEDFETARNVRYDAH